MDLAERHVALSEVKHLLEAAEGQRGELTYEQKLALEHARRFARFTTDALKQLTDELSQNAKIDAGMAARVADLAPAHVDDLRALLAKARVNLTDPELQKILESVAKYRLP